MQIIILLLLVGVPFLFYGGPGSHGSRSFIALWDLGHVLFFFLTSLWLFKRLQCHFARLPVFATFRNVFLIVLILGAIVEGLQMCSGDRLADVNDILRNQLGCLIAFAFCYPQKGYKKFVFRFVILVFVSISLIPLTRGVTDEWIARHQFPVLSDFETVCEIDRWRKGKGEGLLSVKKGLARHGEQSLRVQLTTDTYSGVSLEYFQGNWQGFKNLFLSVYNPDDKPLELICRIHDSAHVNRYNDRFNKKFILKKGWNDLVVSLNDVENSPKGRLLNLAEIQNLKLFVMEQKSERVIYVDSVYLGK